jgi:hypothetical protein
VDVVLAAGRHLQLSWIRTYLADGSGVARKLPLSSRDCSKPQIAVGYRELITKEIKLNEAIAKFTK